jgi:hypothetical protein
MSDKSKTVIEVLGAVMEDVSAVGKKDRNTQQGYDFRGIDAVINAVGPAFRRHGIVPAPIKSEAKYRDVLTINGKPSRECTVTVTYRFYGPAGDFIDCEVPGESMDFGDKGAPKAMSVAYRIALLQVLCIPTHEPEPDAQSYERAAAPVWDPVEQELLFDGFKAEIEAAKTPEELGGVAKRMQGAVRSKEMSKATYDKLAQVGAARRAELNSEAVPA